MAGSGALRTGGLRAAGVVVEQERTRSCQTHVVFWLNDTI